MKIKKLKELLDNYPENHEVVLEYMINDDMTVQCDIVTLGESTNNRVIVLLQELEQVVDMGKSEIEPLPPNENTEFE